MLSALTAGLVCTPATWATDPNQIRAVRGLLEQGQHQGALERIIPLLVECPTDPHLRFLKGVAVAELGDVDSAIDEFSKLASDHPKLPEPHNNLAVLYASQGAYEKARDALLVALRTHPSYAVAHENLGDIYAKMARISYYRALSINRSGRTGQTKLELLRDLMSLPEAEAGPSISPSASHAAAMDLGGQSLPDDDGPVPRHRERGPGTETVADRELSLISPERAVATIQDWAEAWSSQDVDAYLAYYSDDFRPPYGWSRARWEAQRVRRIRGPRRIRVQVRDFEFRAGDDGETWVRFSQHYRSDRYQDRVRKTMALREAEGGIRILVERTVQP